MVVTTKINNTEYELSTRLRVAYKVQGCHNHKPYAEIFKNITDMSLEQQIEILYESFADANPDMRLSLKKQDFLNYYLDNYKLKQVMSQLQGVIKGIMGDEGADDTEDADEEPVNQGN